MKTIKKDKKGFFVLAKKPMPACVSKKVRVQSFAIIFDGCCAHPFEHFLN